MFDAASPGAWQSRIADIERRPRTIAFTSFADVQIARAEYTARGRRNSYVRRPSRGGRTTGRVHEIRTLGSPSVTPYTGHAGLSRTACVRTAGRSPAVNYPTRLSEDS